MLERVEHRRVVALRQTRVCPPALVARARAMTHSDFGFFEPIARLALVIAMF